MCEALIIVLVESKLVEAVMEEFENLRVCFPVIDMFIKL